MEQGAGRTGCVGHDSPDPAQHSTPWVPEGMIGEPSVTAMCACVSAVCVTAHVHCSLFNIALVDGL